MCISDTSREHRLSRGPGGESRHPCISLDTCGSIDTIVSLRRANPHPSTCPPSCLHPVSAAPELVGDSDDALPSVITTVITHDTHCPDIANISTQCANIEISCTTSVPRPIKFHGTCLIAALLNSPVGREHGGGVAIIHKDGLSAQTVTTTGAGYTTFEHCDVQFTNNSGLLNIIVVYHPLPTKRNGHMVSAFLDEFRSLLEDRMSSPGHLVILGTLSSM